MVLCCLYGKGTRPTNSSPLVADDEIVEGLFDMSLDADAVFLAILLQLHVGSDRPHRTDLKLGTETVQAASVRIYYNCSFS